jgi:tRNA A-37 threonylcarbamoyl transferase component Bud32
MVWRLSSANVIDYLKRSHLYQSQEITIEKIEERSSKNFNLLVQVTEEPQLLVKQERYAQTGKVRGDFLDEWQIHNLLNTFTELAAIRPLICEPIHFDAEQGIVVFPYLHNYRDLNDFYNEHQVFASEVSASIGEDIALIHCHTINQTKYRAFLSQNRKNRIDKVPNFLRGLEKITPDIFGQVTSDALEFFRLYQLYDSLGNAIAHLQQVYQPCCLIHYDLSLDNILLHQEWQNLLTDSPASENHQIIKIIDWELCRWGDPLCDLGKLISSYLKLWLKSLNVSADIEIELALQIAKIPLAQIQPSITALTQGYLLTFPEIEQIHPDFWVKLVQFTGLDLLRSLLIKIGYQRPFDNIDICTLQVAKSLLCRPQQSMATVFGDEVDC